jgi:hypothetical protein
MRIDQHVQLDALVAAIADEYGLDATLRTENGRFSVRFSLPLEHPEPSQSSGSGSWLRRIFPWWTRAEQVSWPQVEPRPSG